MDTYKLIETIYEDGSEDDVRIVRRITSNPLYALKLRDMLRREAERKGTDAYTNFFVRRTSDDRLIEFEQDLQQDWHCATRRGALCRPGQHDADDEIPW